MASEAELQREILRWLKRESIEHWRMPIGPILKNGGKTWASNPLKGFPDLMGVCTKESPGRMWAIELKSAKGQLSAEQVTWLARLKMAGAHVAVIKSLPEAVLFFKAIGEL